MKKIIKDLLLKSQPSGGVRSTEILSPQACVNGIPEQIIPSVPEPE